MGTSACSVPGKRQAQTDALASPALAGGFFTTSSTGEVLTFLPRVKSSVSMSCVILKFQMAPFSQLHGTERGRNTQKGRVHAGHRKGGKATGFLPSGLWGKDHMETTTGDRCCRGSMLGGGHGVAAGPLWSWNGNQEWWEEPGGRAGFSPASQAHASVLGLDSPQSPLSFLPSHIHTVIISRESIFLGGTSGKEPACQCRRFKRHGFDPWVGMIPWRRAWQPTSAFLPGKFHGQGSLAGYSPWGCKESDTTEQLSPHTRISCNNWCVNRSVMSDSLQFHGHRSPWNSPDKNTGVGCHSLLQGIFPDQGLLHCRQIVYRQ